MNNIYQNVHSEYAMAKNNNHLIYQQHNHFHPTNCYAEQIQLGDPGDKVAVHMGDGWCTFPDLDNFDSEKLLRALTLKVSSSFY